MRLLLIRHAQSTNNLLYAETGQTVGRSHDPPLTPLGHEQARALGAFAPGDATYSGLAHLYCSLTTRAVQTAAPLAAALGLPVQGLPHAHETGGLFLRDEAGVAYGVPGRRHSDLLTENPALRWPADLGPDEPWAGGFEDERDPAVFVGRAGQVLSDLRAAHQGEEGVVGLVTHGNFSQFLLQVLLGHGAARFRIHNTATTLLTLPPAQPPAQTPTQTPADAPAPHLRVEWVNRFDHLAPEQLTRYTGCG